MPSIAHGELALEGGGMSRWWRAHASALDDPKVQLLSGDMFKAWFNVLCIASLHEGILPSLAEIAFSLRKSEEATAKIMAVLIERGLIDVTGAGSMPHNWNGRQYKSDVSNERVKRFRERQRNGECNVTETPSESDTESEADTEKKEQDHSVANAPPKRGARLTDDWALTDELRAFARNLNLDPDAERDAFVDYWTSVPGSKGLKLDWRKTFKNRCRDLAKRPQRAKTFERQRQDAEATVVSRDDKGQWAARLRGYHPGGFWLEHDWGPPPESGKCRAPSDQITDWQRSLT